MKTIDDILTEDINENSEQVFNGGDIVIFFNKSDLINNFTNNWFWKDAKNLKKKRDVEAKMKRKNIEFYYYSRQKMENIDNKYNFNDDGNTPKFNELYFKLKDYNPDKIRYYTYNNYIKAKEDYKYDFIVNLFTKFGLKYMSWAYILKNSNSNKKSRVGDIETGGNGINVSFSNLEENTELTQMYGSKEFRNTGSFHFFNTCFRRVFWYSFCSKNIEDIIKHILKDSKIYFYEYYENCYDLRVKMEHRLNSAYEIDYTFEKDETSKIVLDKMLKISSIYGKLGFKVNEQSISSSSYNKKYRIEFYSTKELEKVTLENIIWDKTLQNKNINMEMVNNRYKLLSENDVKRLNEENARVLSLINLKTKTIRKTNGFDEDETVSFFN
jgi:hypothetical protein